MPCMIFKHSGTGKVRAVQVDKGMSVMHQPNEVLVRVDPHCDETFIGMVEQHNKGVPISDHGSLMHEMNEAIGGGAGDWIKAMVAPFAKLIGKKSCTQCEARRLATNAYAKLKVKYGQIEALRIIKELWQMSMKEPGDTVLTKLKGYLDGELHD